MADMRTKAPTLPLKDGAQAKEVMCPLCAQSLPCADFLHTKDFSILVRAAHIAQLSPNEGTIFGLMVENRASGISQDAIVERLYSSNGGPTNAKECVYGAIASIKRKVAPLHISIKSSDRVYRPYFNA